jgi:hypothetical protein
MFRIPLFILLENSDFAIPPLDDLSSTLHYSGTIFPNVFEIGIFVGRLYVADLEGLGTIKKIQEV